MGLTRSQLRRLELEVAKARRYMAKATAPTPPAKTPKVWHRAKRV